MQNKIYSIFLKSENKKIFFILLLNFLFLLKKDGKAQGASGIPFSFSVSPSVAPLPSWSNFAVPAGYVDEWDTLFVPAGWSFIFAEVTYNKVVISSNGWLALIPSSAPAINPLPYPANSNPNNQLNNNTTGFPIIAPLWDDLSTSLIRWNLTSNILSISWYVKWQNANTAANTNLFWLELDGTIGVNTISFHYINNASYTPLIPTASIGIAGVCPGDFYSVSCQSAVTATVDSSVENTSIGDSTINNFRPYNVNYLFTPYNPYDNCSGNFSALDLGILDSTCTNTLVSTFNATASGSGNCIITDTNDVWFSFIKPMGYSFLGITTSPANCESVAGTSVEVYASPCGSTLLDCATSSNLNPNFGQILLVRPINTVETLLVRVTSDGDIAGKFNICISGNTPTEINNPLTQNDISRVFPNPFSNELNFFRTKSTYENGEVKLYNVMGKEIFNKEILTDETKINTENIEQGLYLLIYTDKNITTKTKVLKY